MLTVAELGMIGPIGGMKIIENPFLIETIEVWTCRPRSKAKRIVKKWKKRYAYMKTIPARYGVFSNESMIVHPQFAAELRKQLGATDFFKPASERITLKSTPTQDHSHLYDHFLATGGLRGKSPFSSFINTEAMA